ncbi:MAG TPA: response regulator, partial [Holophaga sp.]|nr:response regulator [Holophaga sp.]
MPDAYVPTPENPGRILVVDDLPGNLKVLGAELKHHPFVLTLTQSAEEALERCREQAFEGILMDVSLTGMDGIEACRRIRELPLNDRTPLIFLSAVRVGQDWISEGIEAGGIDYLVKPYAFPELLAKLRMMVRLRRQDEAALAGERNRALLEVAGGTAHELAQPLAAAQILLDRLMKSPEPPTSQQLATLRECLHNTGRVLAQIQRLHTYITKPYAKGRILDLALS